MRAEDLSGIASVRAYSETPGGWQRMTCEPELHSSNWDPDVWVLRAGDWGTDAPPIEQIIDGVLMPCHDNPPYSSAWHRTRVRQHDRS